MIITSRKGLFYFQNNESILLKDIQCFGICNFPNDIYLVFHFLGEIGKDTKQGKITRFVIRGDKIIEENEIIKDLDNGVHEITSTGKDIIILQTYYQNIIRYQLDDNYFPILSSKEILPWSAWLSIKNSKLSSFGSLPDNTIFKIESSEVDTD